MAFQFNFPDPAKDTDNSKFQKQAESESAPSADVLECCEVEEETNCSLEYRESDILSYRLADDICIRCLDSQQVEHRLCDTSNEGRDGWGVVTAAKAHSDLIPNVYEGGLKVWECSSDLCDFLLGHRAVFRHSTVLELGCGAGLPGILAMMLGASDVHLQDYNIEVIENYTVPNVKLNKGGNSDCRCRYFSGDWDCFRGYLPGVVDTDFRYDVILTAETIYKPENYQKLTRIFSSFLRDTGVVYVAAKSHYFGVGGGTAEFLQFVSQEKVFHGEVCHTIAEGVPREIIKLTRS